MSLKAYDGMMTRDGLSHIHTELQKRMDKFKELSLDKLAKTYAELIVNYTDKNRDIYNECYKWHSHNEVKLKEQLKKIELDDTTIISVIHQAGKILSTGDYVNDFMVHLNLTLDTVNGKTLVMPNILVKEHRELLLEFLTDWYAQDQVDPDETVPEDEWNERVNDWWNFNEIQGLHTKIVLFEPDHYWNSLNKHFRGDEMFERVLKFIPSDENRIREIVFTKLVDEKVSKLPQNTTSYGPMIDIATELRKDDNTEVDDYIKNNKIQVTKIDKDYLNSKYIQK
jgi:hypothetical protein